jgi:hypothetical protein
MTTTPPHASRFATVVGRSSAGVLLGVVIGLLIVQNVTLAFPTAGELGSLWRVVGVVVLGGVGGLAGWVRGPVSRVLGGCLVGALCGALCGAVIGWTWGRLVEVAERQTALPTGVLIGMIAGGVGGALAALRTPTRR